MQNDTLPLPIQSPLLAAFSENRVRHGFFTRQGGVSEGLYQGLNVGLGSHDEPELVQENRRRVTQWFGLSPERLATVHQVHSPDVLVVDESYDGSRPQADAMVTSTPGFVLGVLSADCGPILFADPQAGVVGAAHAGWKGALFGVLENTIETMVKLGANRDRIAGSFHQPGQLRGRTGIYGPLHRFRSRLCCLLHRLGKRRPRTVRPQAVYN